MMVQQFDYSVNLLQSLLWQYGNTVSLQSLLTQKQAWYDTNQKTFWTDWYTNVFNLQTANLFGLSVWSIILGVPLFVPLNPDPEGKPIWGFNQRVTVSTQTGTLNTTTTVTGLSNTALLTVGNIVFGKGVVVGTTIASITNSTTLELSAAAVATETSTLIFQTLALENTYQNFGIDGIITHGGNFSNQVPAVTLTLEEQRFILRLRYFQLVTRGAIPEINSFLNYLTNSSSIVPVGRIYALDNLNMTMTYVFNFNISPNLLAAIRYGEDGYDLLPRPAGVGIDYLVNNGTVWGFNKRIVVSTQTGTLNGTTTVSGLANTALLTPGLIVSGDGITVGTIIASITNSTTIVLSAVALISGSSSLEFQSFSLENDYQNFGNGNFI